MSSPVAAAARCRAVPCSFCGGSPYRARETEPCTCSLERSSSRSVPLCRGGAIRPLQWGAGMALRFGALSQDSPPGTSHPDLVVRILSRLARPRRCRGWARCAPFLRSSARGASTPAEALAAACTARPAVAMDVASNRLLGADPRSLSPRRVARPTCVRICLDIRGRCGPPSWLQMRSVRGCDTTRGMIDFVRFVGG
jgi:hypothetical protein